MGFGFRICNTTFVLRFLNEADDGLRLCLTTIDSAQLPSIPLSQHRLRTGRQPYPTFLPFFQFIYFFKRSQNALYQSGAHALIFHFVETPYRATRRGGNPVNFRFWMVT